jgi:hypothetical protein
LEGTIPIHLREAINDLKRDAPIEIAAEIENAAVGVIDRVRQDTGKNPFPDELKQKIGDIIYSTVELPSLKQRLEGPPGPTVAERIEAEGMAIQPTEGRGLGVVRDELVTGIVDLIAPELDYDPNAGAPVVIEDLTAVVDGPTPGAVEGLLRGGKEDIVVKEEDGQAQAQDQDQAVGAPVVIEDPTAVVEDPTAVVEEPNAIDAIAGVLSDPGQPMEEKEKTIDEYKQEFIDALPGYEGKTQFEKGMDLATFGAAIMAGRSQHAIQNIGDAFLAMGDRFTTDDKERRAYKTAIDLSAAKYGMARINEIRTQRRADERAFTSFVANEPVRIDGIDYGEGDSVLLSTAFLVKHGRVPKGLTAEDLAVAENSAAAKRSSSFLTHLTGITKNQQLDPSEATAWTEQYENNRDNVYTSNEMLDGIDKLIEGVTFEGDKIFGATGAWTSLMEKLQASVGMTDDKKWTLQQWESQLAQVLNRGIGMTLRENQSANSISNRDVEWYIQAYFNGLGLDPSGKGHKFSFAEVFKHPAPLFNRLHDLRGQIEAKRSSSLAGLDSIENQLRGRTTRQLERIDAETFLPIYKPGMSLIVPLRGTDVSDRWATEIEPLRGTSVSRVHKGFTMTQSPEYGAVWTRNKGNSG